MIYHICCIFYGILWYKLHRYLREADQKMACLLAKGFVRMNRADTWHTMLSHFAAYVFLIFRWYFYGLISICTGFTRTINQWEISKRKPRLELRMMRLIITPLTLVPQLPGRPAYLIPFISAPLLKWLMPSMYIEAWRDTHESWWCLSDSYFCHEIGVLTRHIAPFIITGLRIAKD